MLLGIQITFLVLAGVSGIALITEKEKEMRPTFLVAAIFFISVVFIAQLIFGGG